ncbi:MAG: porin [Gammaproteobacteria bacterium]|nr:porin [Rhodocyclaceae bacterium]MBU3909270.1 porin [Gammaproteobacteria bacterium]MBU3989536.1 porin [Gammaproteobacteria bacterium]MBU4005570.1 porin [Gammaproteobacteria bacterium]MBU4020877.1 porin [Gammaproteobacteria bacterium]
MMKKLIPAAILLTAMGAAHAELAVYGLVDISYGKNIADDAADRNARIHSGGDDGSSQGNSVTRVGLKGSNDLGSGLKANFKLETAGIDRDLRIGKEDKLFFNRQAWAGLSGSFGEVRFGRQDSVPFQMMGGYDFNGLANAASALGNSGVAAWGRGRQTQSLQYISPSMSGFTAQVGFAGKEDGVRTNDAKATTSAGLTYVAGKFSVSVVGETKREDSSENFAGVSGSYDFGVVKVMASYSDGFYGTNSKGPGVGFVAPVAGFNVGMMYGKNNDTDAAATELFINREIFKNTYAYADFARVNQTSYLGPRGNAYALGVIYVFDIKLSGGR